MTWERERAAIVEILEQYSCECRQRTDGTECLRCRVANCLKDHTTAHMEPEVRAVWIGLQARGMLGLSQRVADAYGFSVEALISRRKSWRLGLQHRSVGHARAVLWAVLYDRGHWSLPRLATVFHRDHTTILAGVRKVTPHEIEPFRAEERVA